MWPIWAIEKVRNGAELEGAQLKRKGTYDERRTFKNRFTYDSFRLLGHNPSVTLLLKALGIEIQIIISSTTDAEEHSLHELPGFPTPHCPCRGGTVLENVKKTKDSRYICELPFDALT